MGRGVGHGASMPILGGLPPATVTVHQPRRSLNLIVQDVLTSPHPEAKSTTLISINSAVPRRVTEDTPVPQEMPRVLGAGGQEWVGMKTKYSTSLVVQWLRIHLPTQGTRVPSLAWKDPTCRGAGP